MDKLSNVLLPPRWKDGPPICAAENLPAFESKAAIAEYREKQCPSTTLLEQWQCKACGMWHFRNRCAKRREFMQVDITKTWQRSAVPKEQFKARNGDTLNDLNNQKAELTALLIDAREILMEKEHALEPFRARVNELQARVDNLSCRLNVWWGEYEGRH